MSHEQKWTSLRQGLTRGQLSRRDFVKKALALGVGLSGIAAALMACSRDKEQPATGKAVEPKDPAGDDKKPGGELEKELRIYNWSDYIAKDTVSNFEKEFGVKVIYDTYESNEELLAKLQAGASGYDLVCPSGFMVPALVALDLIDAIDRSRIPNSSNLSDIFAGLPYDPPQKYSLPYQWGITGVAYRKDKVKAPVESWGVLHDTQYAGKMTQTDDMRDVIGCWLKYRGKSANSVVPEELEQAKKDALLAKKNIKSYISAPVKGQLITGDVWIAQLWSGDTVQAQAEQPEIQFVIPNEGGTMFVDTMLIPKKAPHKRAAYAFLDYILRPDVGAAISDVTGYGSPNTKALALMKNPVPFPSAEDREKLEFSEDLGEHTQLWDRIWTEIKAG